jgi:hypothetical protein
MRLLCQKIARMANAEDGVTGKFLNLPSFDTPVLHWRTAEQQITPHAFEIARNARMSCAAYAAAA